MHRLGAGLARQGKRNDFESALAEVMPELVAPVMRVATSCILLSKLGLNSGQLTLQCLDGGGVLGAGGGLGCGQLSRSGLAMPPSPIPHVSLYLQWPHRSLHWTHCTALQSTLLQHHTGGRRRVTAHAQ